MQMVVAVTAGKPIFERATSQRPAWFITDEDDEDDIKPVMVAMAEDLEVKFADLPLEVSSLLDHDISIADIDDNGKVELLAFYRYLDKKLATRRGSLVVIDCLNDIAIMQEAGRAAPNAFFKKVMTPLCKKHGVTILILAHPSKAAMISGAWYSGSTGYKTAVRHKLVMKLVDPKDIYGPRTLETLKKNWGKRSPPITLTWQRGIFILDRDDATGAMKYRTVVRKILEVIGDGGRVARSNQADCTTPKTLAADIVDAEGATLTTAKDVSAFMRRAEAEGVLKYIEAIGHHEKSHFEAGDNADDFGTIDDTADDDPDLA
jgi:RecA-family ATPase